MSAKTSRIEKNVAKSRTLGEEMQKSAATVVGALDRASRSRASRSSNGVVGQYVTVSGKARSIRTEAR